MLMTAISNVLVILAGIFVFRPSAMTVLWSFWLESVCLGILTAIQIWKLPDFTFHLGTGPEKPRTLPEKRKTALSFLGFGAMFYFILFNVISGSSTDKSLNFGFIAASTGILFVTKLVLFLAGRFVPKTAEDQPPDLTHLVFAPITQMILAIPAVFAGIPVWIFLSFIMLFSGLPGKVIDKAATDVTVLILVNAIIFASEYGVPVFIRWLRKQKILEKNV